MIKRIENLYSVAMTRGFDNIRNTLPLIGRLHDGWQLFVAGKGKLGNAPQAVPVVAVAEGA